MTARRRREGWTTTACARRSPSWSAAVRALALVCGCLFVASQTLADTPAHPLARNGMRCVLFAAPSGSDRADGSFARPFATAQRLLEALRAGQAGCLRGGAYSAPVTVARGGAPGRPVTLTSYPGERAALLGRLYVRQRAHDLVFSRLLLDGANSAALPSPTVYGWNVRFLEDDVTDGHTSICFDLGEARGPMAENIEIERSVVHDCGRLPAGNHEHGIYVENARDVLIAWNLIFANADRGIQLYPDAQDTRILHNVIYGNGEGILFSGGFGTASSGDLVAHNIIGGSHVRSNIESWYPAGNPVGSGNLVTDNCIGAASTAPLNRSGGGFDAVNNLLVEPHFADVRTGDFSVPEKSRCGRLSGDVSATARAAL